MGDYVDSVCRRWGLGVEVRTPLEWEIEWLQRQLALMKYEMRALLRFVYTDGDVQRQGEEKLHNMDRLRQRMLATRQQIAELRFQYAARN